LLAALPQDEFDLVAAALRPKTIGPSRLCRHGDAIKEVYFPAEGAFSLERVSEDGRVSEIALVGAEGLIGGEIFYGTTEFSTDCQPIITNVPVYAMSAVAFRQHVERFPGFHNLVVRYQQSLMSQIAQTLACSGLHSAKQRTCRWLLMVHDRVMRDLIPISDVRLGEMLGIRSQSVGRVTKGLAVGGALTAYRDGFVLHNREDIAAAACECYQTMRLSFERLLPEISAPRPDPSVVREARG
jgi:CRP-like cAMP-binding protein